jgi:hypothetical protein
MRNLREPGQVVLHAGIGWRGTPLTADLSRPAARQEAQNRRPRRYRSRGSQRARLLPVYAYRVAIERRERPTREAHRAVPHWSATIHSEPR